MKTKTTKTDLLNKVEKKVGTFSTYQTTAGPGDKIPFAKRPAQQVLEKLGVPSTSASKAAPLSHKADQSLISTESNTDLTITSFDDAKTGELKITGERITRLVKSAKTYVNTDIVPKGKFKDVLKAKSSISATIEDSTGTYWQNLAVGICHAQEVDLLVEHNLVDGKAVAGVRTGIIEIDAPAMVLLSTPAIDFCRETGGLGNTLRADQRKTLIKGMYANLFKSAIDQKCKAITLPAAGLGVFEGNSKEKNYEYYHQALFELALEYPELKIIYNPGKYTTLFTQKLEEFTQQHPNTKLRMTTKDVVFLADKLTRKGERTACHNPSDAKVVLGEYDVGMHWKQSNPPGKNNTYVGEEHIGAMSTAPMNSFGLNPAAYNDFVEVSFKKDLIIEVPKNAPSDAAKDAIEFISEIIDRFEENDEEKTLSAKDVTSITKKLTNLFPVDLDHIQIALKEKGLELDLRLSKTKSPSTRSKAINTFLTSKKATNNPEKDSLPVGTVQLNYFEKSNYDYFSIDKEGNLVCLVPFTATNGYFISSENTCKTGQTMRSALVGSLTQQPKILQVLEQYMQDLRNDFGLLGFQTNKTDSELHNFLLTQIATSNDEALKGKATRFIQLIKYKSVLQQVTSDAEIKNNLSDFGAHFPQPLKTVLEKSNAVAFNIETQAKYEDGYLRQQAAYVCTFKRGYAPSNFSMQLKTSLTKTARQNALRIKKPKVHLTQDQLIEKIYTKYQADTKYKKLDSGSYPITKTADIQILRNAILEAIKGFVPDYGNWQNMINQPYFNNQDKVSVPDADLPQFMDDVFCVPPEELSCFDLINGILLTEEQIQDLTKDPECLPFEEERINTPAVFNDLIQIFIASANYAYIEYASSKGHPNERKTDFGKAIETETEQGNFIFGSQLKQVSLIKAIEKAIDEKSSLEEAILDWLEGHVLNNKPANLKKFSSETRERAKAIFRHHFTTLYDLNEPSPHNDEYLMAIANNPEDPTVVAYRGALTVPLSKLCNAFTSKPWLANEFKKSNHDINLPQGVQLNLDSDNVTVTSCVPQATCSVNVMKKLEELIEKDTLCAAKFLLNTTKEGKKIFELLNKEQTEGLKKFPNWSLVQLHAYSLIKNVSEQNQFKDKFKTKATIHITLEMEQALYAAFSQFNDIDKLFEGAKRGASIMLAIRGLCNERKIYGNFDTNITSTGTYIFESNNPEVINLIKEVYRVNKTCMTITSRMAGNFYKQINNIDPDTAGMVQDNSGSSAMNTEYQELDRHDQPMFQDTQTDRQFASRQYNDSGRNPWNPHFAAQNDHFSGRGAISTQNTHVDRSSNAAAQAVINITSEHKFIKTLKVLFPDLTILGIAEPLPEGMNEGSDELVRVKFNLFNGYQIISLNPDNLNRIRDCYQTSTTRVLSFQEAKKFIHYAASQPNTKLKKPLDLNTATLEAALIELGIVYTAVGQVDQTYQIICEDLPWKTITENKSTVKDKPDFNPDPNLCTYEIAKGYYDAVQADKKTDPAKFLSKHPSLPLAKEFFDAIQEGKTVRAKELLAMHPTLLNSFNPNYPSSPLITAITFAYINSDARDSLLEFASELLATPGIELTHKDMGGNTCLHKSIYYAHEHLKQQQLALDQLIKQNPTQEALKQQILTTPFDKISAEIWKLAQLEGTTEYFETEKNYRSTPELAFTHDKTMRVRKNIFKNTFWEKLTETRYFNFTPALKLLAEDKVLPNDFKKAILNEVHPKTNKLPLEMAIERGNAKAVNELINNGADLNKPLTNNKTPLELAIQLGQANVVKELLLKGANPNLAFANKKFPLEMAIESGNVKIVQLLLTNRADTMQSFTTKDAYGDFYTPLSLTLALGQNLQIKDAEAKSKEIFSLLAPHFNGYQLGQFVTLLSSRFLTVQKTLATSQQKHAEVQAQLQELQKNPLVNMEKKEQDQQQILTEHEEKLNQLAKEIALSQSKQQQMQDELNSLKAIEMKLATALDASKGHEAKLNKVNERNESLVQQIQIGSLQNNELEQAGNRLQESQVALENRNKKTEVAITQAAEKRKELKAGLAPLLPELKKLKAEKEALQTELDTLEKNKAALLSQISEQTATNSEKTTVLEQLTTSYQKLEKEIAALEKDLRELPQKKAELEASTVSLKTAYAAIEQKYLTQHQELAIAGIKSKELQGKLDTTLATNAALTKDNEVKVKENQALTEKVLDLKLKNIQLENQKIETEALVAQNADATFELEQEKLVADEVNKKLRLKETENAELRKALAAKEAENAKLSEQLRLQELAHNKLTQQNTNVTNQVRTATHENKKLDSKVTKLATQKNQLEATTKKLTTEITKLEKEVGPLELKKQALKQKQADMDSCFVLNFLTQLSGGEILVYALLATLLLASIAGIALATWGTGLIGGVAIASTVLTAGITGASASGAGLLVTTGYSLFSQCRKDPEEEVPAAKPKQKIT